MQTTIKRTKLRREVIHHAKHKASSKARANIKCIKISTCSFIIIKANLKLWWPSPMIQLP